MNPFETVPLGGTNIRLSRLGLGTAPLGGFQFPVTESDAEKVVETTYERGIRFFDTAPYYGHGRAEEIVGRSLRRYRRDSYVLASKVGYLLRRGAAPHARAPLAALSDYERLFPIYDFSSEGIRRSYEESLSRLGLQRVDILHVHDAEDYLDQAISESFPELEAMRSEGLIGAISAGLNSAQALAKLVKAVRLDCILLANEYTLINQTALDELLELCVKRGVAVIAGAVLGGGIMADPTSEPYSAFPLPSSALSRTKELETVCHEFDIPLAAAAIQFPLGHPAVKSVVLGIRSVGELDQDLALFDLDIPDDLWIEMKARGLLAKDVPTPTIGDMDNNGQKG